MSPQTKAGAQRTVVPGRPSLPQVNLLPPEIRAGRALTSVKSWLGIVLLVTVLVAGGLVVMSELGLRSAESDFAETQDDNAALVAQQAQYAQVPALLGRLDNLTQARLTGMASEVLWRPYVVALAATAPAGVSITNLKVAPPITDQLVTTGELSDVVIATVSFEAESVTLPDTAAWLDALAPVVGFSDPEFSSAMIKGDSESGLVFYSVTGSVDVTFDGLAMRFVATEEPTDEAEED